jgi:phage terminase large subunit-like protein
MKKKSRAERVIAFIEAYGKVPEGSKVGSPIVLAEFQKQFIRDIYDNKAGTRRAYLSIARKNGKTALIAGILLAHICGPEARLNSQIISGAMSRDQAALVFALASKMISLDPRLQAVCKTIPSGKRIIGLSKNVEFKALAADGTTAHGLSPVLAILDEVGQIRGSTSEFIEAITTSQGAHEEPLLIAISTSAPSDADMFSMWCDDAIRNPTPHIVCHVYKADENSELLDKKQWKKANPALGVFRSEKDLEEQLLQASRLPALEASARNLLLNQRVSLESMFIAPSIWKENNGDPDIEVFRNNSVSIGLDLSARTDLTAAVCAARDEDGVVHLLPFVFTPMSGLEERARRDRAPYDAWVRDGKMIAVPGASIDYEFVAEWLRDTLDDLGISVTTIEFDRWRIEIFKKAADDVGFCPFAQWNPVGQGYRDFSPRVEAFEQLLLSNKIRHGSHPLLNLAASNAIAVSDPAGNRKLDKSKATQRIDPLVAAVMAVHVVSEGSENSFDVSAMIG